jgi:hypothetical protein
MISLLQGLLWETFYIVEKTIEEESKNPEVDHGDHGGHACDNN